jgi:hypothetical protein
MTATANSPTVTELLDAAVENYTQSGEAGDLTPFLVNGQQLQVTNYAAGLVATTWLTPDKQVVISYEGTFGNTPNGYSPSFLVDELEADTAGLSSTKPFAGETAGLAFADQVEADAASQGISAGNIFVTGHSLGAALASYVAENTGFGGIAFEPFGIAPAVGTVGNGDNFVAIDTYGDAIPAYASNESGIGPVAPAKQPLYGQVLHVGDPAWQVPLNLEADTYGLAIALGGKAAQVAAEITLFSANLLDHLPLTQAHALGVTLPVATNAFGVAIDTIGNTTGPVLNVGADTVSQLLAYIAATDGNTDASAAPVSSTPLVAKGARQAQNFASAMASLAPGEALDTRVGMGVQAPSALLGLAGGSFQHNTHVTSAN